MRFLVDAQLPPGLAGWLRARGHEAQHVSEALGGLATDTALAEAAVASGAVIVSKDSDFIDLTDAGGPRLLWVRFGNVTNTALFAQLEERWADIEADLAAGAVVVVLE
jgi:predicted nuclease of predicted toxin-antitoxin system